MSCFTVFSLWKPKPNFAGEKQPYLKQFLCPCRNKRSIYSFYHECTGIKKAAKQKHHITFDRLEAKRVLKTESFFYHTLQGPSHQQHRQDHDVPVVQGSSPEKSCGLNMVIRVMWEKRNQITSQCL